MTAALSFTDLTKTFRLYDRPRDRLVEAVTRRPRHAAVHALRGVSASVAPGEAVGIIGENGSGKSTLLKILSGTMAPTSGSFATPGRIASILELGSAFQPEQTGRRNARLQAAIAGLTRAEAERALPEVEAFAELGDFFDRPVKTYSTGMSLRLAFAVATSVLPDVVILDEALAVGDGRFQKKCVDRIHDLKTEGKTLLFVSHAMYYVSTLCDRVLWLRDGSVAADGPAQSVVLRYERHLAARTGDVAVATGHAPAGTTHGRLLAVRLLDGSGRPRDAYRPGEPWVLDVSFEADAADRPVQVFFGVATRDQVNCFSGDSRRDGIGPFVGRTRYDVRARVRSLPLSKGEFIVNVFLGDERSLAVYDSATSLSFRVESDTWRPGLVDVGCEWEAAPAPESF